MLLGALIARLQDEHHAAETLEALGDLVLYAEVATAAATSDETPGGYLAASVDLFAPGPGEPPPTRTHWALEHSMADPHFRYPTVAEVRELLVGAGFTPGDQAVPLPPLGEPGRYSTGWAVLEAVRA